MVEKILKELNGFSGSSVYLMQDDTKLKIIENRISSVFPECFNDYLLILMLLRVYRHSVTNSFEQMFLLTEITKLWTMK